MVHNCECSPLVPCLECCIYIYIYSFCNDNKNTESHPIIGRGKFNENMYNKTLDILNFFIESYK